jgi:arginyl-tRNA synthetase
MFKENVARLLEVTGLPEEEIIRLLEVPPDSKLGDFAFPCFALSKSMKKAPNAIAAELAEKIKPEGAVKKVAAVGPYVNFFIDTSHLGKSVVKKVVESGSLYGMGSPKDEKIMIEYPSPNTNKPLHIGHARNMLLGNAMCNILGFSGYKVIPVNLVNDRGVHICKSMLAYKKWGHNASPDKKSDHYVGDYYVLYSKKVAEHPELENEVQEMLRLWEAKDHETLELWKKMRTWALDGHDQTYHAMGVHHKKTYYESDIYTHGKELVMEGLDKGVFEKEDGAVVANLEKFGLGKKVLLRSDGTSIYITQDIYLAKQKFDDFAMDRSIHVVGSEQMHHFKVLFKLLELLDMPFARKCHHLSYGMIYLPEGKMKSREGTVVDTDNLLHDLKEAAYIQIRQRHPELHKDGIEKRGLQIALGAMKFFILKYDAAKDFTYNPNDSLSFEGETGPYVQYAHARICSIFRQVEDWKPQLGQLTFEHEKEHQLVNLLSQYPQVVEEAAEKYNPSLVARHALVIAQAFSEFYNECPVLKAEKEKESRLALCHATRVVLQSALNLLGIEAPEEM